MDILDTAGQEEYSSLREMVRLAASAVRAGACALNDQLTLPHSNRLPQYIRSSNCYVIVYDITSRSSFEEARLMRQFIARVRDTEQPYIVRRTGARGSTHVSHNCPRPR